MQNRIVEIASDGVFLNLSRGFLSIVIDGKKAGQVAIEDMSALIIRGHGTTLSVNVCSRLAEQNIPIVICGTNQAPASVVWPISGHFMQGLHMQAQAVARKPLLKQLWAQLARAKITAQAEILKIHDLEHEDISAIARRVKSGDEGNSEAQASRRYWPRLMGKNFRRSTRRGPANGLLNYGYTVLRAGTARSILGAGLHPSLSLHHQSRGNALRLADDLMEPFRPYVDHRVKVIIEKLGDQNDFDILPEHKQTLASVLSLDMQGPNGASPMQACLDRLAQSLVRVFLGEIKKLELPGSPLPMALAAKK